MKLIEGPQPLRRLAALARRDGPVRLAAEHVRRCWNRMVDDRIAVFEWQPETAVPAAGPVGDELWVGRYERPEELPVGFYRAAEAEEGPSALSRMLDEFLDAGVMWVPWFAGRPAGYQWTRRGDRVTPWHFPLEAETTLVFSAVTFQPFRGQGVATRCTAEICRREVAPGGRAVGEAFVWDRASVGTFEAAGFRRVAVHRAYPGYRG